MACWKCQLPKAPFSWQLIIAGYGPTGRDGNASALGLRTCSYTLLAAALSKHGIVSSRYEKRSAGEDAALVLFDDTLRLKNFVKDADHWHRQLRATSASHKPAIDCPIKLVYTLCGSP